MFSNGGLVVPLVFMRPKSSETERQVIESIPMFTAGYPRPVLKWCDISFDRVFGTPSDVNPIHSVLVGLSLEAHARFVAIFRLH